jgi:hypothetical protein
MSASPPSALLTSLGGAHGLGGSVRGVLVVGVAGLAEGGGCVPVGSDGLRAGREEPCKGSPNRDPAAFRPGPVLAHLARAE